MNAIGTWVRRKGRPWHDTESVVAGAAVVHCGRRLPPKPTDERTDVEPPVDDICKGCRRA